MINPFCITAFEDLLLVQSCRDSCSLLSDDVSLSQSDQNRFHNARAVAEYFVRAVEGRIAWAYGYSSNGGRSTHERFFADLSRVLHNFRWSLSFLISPPPGLCSAERGRGSV